MINNKNEQIENVKKVLERHKEEIERYKLKGQKNKVQGPVIGFKMRNGKPTDEVAIIFYVDKKKNENDLRRENIDIIPEEIEGIPTDIVEIPGGFQLRDLKNSHEKDPK
jgi:hypothetical protein